ncbi:MAG: hypothetical protein CFH21_00544 [Alphaproteobacteria bacterium MarineAlpha5_Bin11]|nr:hypothetical protein [Pelagibacteraceae bacterium]PPR44050.1 MAG: hypothetical protein CFH21_00544 [Alphaproteobacteria bacterium MarineAlpha5_Bin11]PPR51985.1 MAG: hypothetical protein CFH20_00173 [Alphaproteobacteria bacterium MarineAlpha5_Bin10]|tara:strand:+ start:183 stop:1241 length:1059 start_codon:yes stop_codon:yes gene_type:complete
MSKTENFYIARVTIFLVLILIICYFLYPFLENAFLSNLYINTTIIVALLFGLGYSTLNIVNINNDTSLIRKFIRNKSSPKLIKMNSTFIKNLAKELYVQDEGKYTFISSSIESNLQEIDSKLATARETSRYMVGLLIFLGLLGTFWGLLNTIGSVGDVIGSLAVNDANMLNFFDSLKEGLNEPLKGMSTAFSSSLFGLAGSLILGFVDLQMGQAQTSFLQTVEKLMKDNSTPHIGKDQEGIDNHTKLAIQKLYDNLGNLTYNLQETSKNQEEIFSYIKDLADNLNKLTVSIQEQDKKLSNFLTTQLNTQSSMLQLTTKLTQEGVMDSESRKHLKNLDIGIQKLVAGTKTKRK